MNETAAQPVTTAEAADLSHAASMRQTDWPLGPWFVAVLLGAAGLVIHALTDSGHDVPWRAAAAAFVLFGSLAAALTIDQLRWREEALFALVLGLVMAGLAWRAVRYGETLPDEEYGFAAGVIACVLAVPLFQANVLRRRLATPYSDVHYHAWADTISSAGALVFTGIAWLVLALLGELFDLLKITLLNDLMRKGWFGWTFSGVAFGAALGTLRNQQKVLGTLQSVVMLVLSLLAVPLAAGLAIFLLATLVSGPDVLWRATSNATPVLLSCAAGAMLLVNAIIRDDEATISRSRVMRVTAVVLVVVILPLAVFAAVSMGLRIGQYGLAPSRLWAAVAIAIACLYGAAYWFAAARGGRANWARALRTANFRLALASCAIALLLALPVLDFGALSTRDQLSRLRAGEVSAENFDYSALRWDFGESGRRALKQLSEGTGRTAEMAKLALEQGTRPYSYDGSQPIRTEADYNFDVQPADPALRRQAMAYLQDNNWQCTTYCRFIDLGMNAEGARRAAMVEGASYQIIELPFDAGQPARPPAVDVAETAEPRPVLRPGSSVEIRTMEKRYVFMDGKPVGQPID
ncbi:DUF4153 domain-containing protein [Altererythrobacter xixiisoli]|uniref:DUF4153 domain-containing protein n=1 Tax=Croceibacterium xixiisoli TaxID=1476466 RepID=A0A6I4TUZ1_9SPHN|nr:DUF4153 domain-containing protein [Croceibacterium xixiisoli]MXO98123.1 DUF4153 domain-containing protein [Croceibacterium xixiisoli]